VFDADKLGKDKSLGKVEINPRDFDFLTFYVSNLPQ